MKNIDTSLFPTVNIYLFFYVFCAGFDLELHGSHQGTSIPPTYATPINDVGIPELSVCAYHDF